MGAENFDPGQWATNLDRGQWATQRITYVPEVKIGAQKRRLVATAQKMQDPDRVIRFTVSNATEDRDGDVVDPAGWDLEQYRKNPVVLWGHESWGKPIAKCVGIEIMDGALVADAEFDTSPAGEEVFGLYKRGMLSAVSAGFRVRKAEPRHSASGDYLGARFLEQELWEFSCVTIPSNPDAVMRAKTAGVSMKHWTEILDSELATGKFDQHTQESMAYVQMTGSVHPAVQDKLAQQHDRKEAPGADVSAEAAPVEKAMRGAQFTTTGGPDHEHAFALGENFTEEAGDPIHVHAVTYDEEGKAIINDAEDHGHDAPEGAMIDPETDEPEQEMRGEDLVETDAAPAVLTEKAPTIDDLLAKIGALERRVEEMTGAKAPTEIPAAPSPAEKRADSLPVGAVLKALAPTIASMTAKAVVAAIRERRTAPLNQ